MPIPIKINSGGENVWGIIELQGDLKSRDGSSLSSQFVGDLHCTIQSNGIPILIIGHHILYGKCIEMEKPLAVLERLRTEENGKEKTEYLVKAIVSKKLVFKIRPKPIIASVE